MAAALGYDATSGGQEVGVPWARLVDCGWTSQVYPLLIAWGAHALDVGAWMVTGGPSGAPFSGGDGAVLMAGVQVIVLAEVTALGGARFEEARPWLRLCVSATDAGDGQFLWQAMLTWAQGGDRSVLPALSARFGEGAPLLFAAGLDLDGMTHDSAATRDASTLAGMAALRGYRFPALD
jgi:hypothetical protein